MNFQPSLNEVVLFNPERRNWMYFRQPVQIVTAGTLEEVRPAVRKAAELVDRRGLFAAGFLAYEAAPAFDPAFRTHPPAGGGFPLAWFGLYPPPDSLPGLDPPDPIKTPPAFHVQSRNLPGPWLSDVRRADYLEVIDRIKAYIARGDTYQVNFTYRLQAAFESAAWPLFTALSGAHAAPYAAFLETQKWAVCSISPELFFHQDGDILTSLPMKGTAPRGLQFDDDREMAEWLRCSEKNRAENVMIVDMVRNDLGRIARLGKVTVPELFRVDQYPTVWQMVSRVQAESPASFEEVLEALFPAASITGAPKIRTMEIIRELESSPRGIYTGTFGYLGPGRQAQFNVAIRTLLIDKTGRRAEYGVGGGIVWDSDPQEEWDETLTKARILSEPPEPFELLETILWAPEDGWFLLDRHLTRLERSAAYFAYPLRLSGVRTALKRMAARFPHQPQVVRLKLARNGEISLERRAPAGSNPSRIGLARRPVNSADRFLYHKTTRRDVYRRAVAELPDCDDVLLWNECGEVTESTIANLAVEIDGRLYTPPVACGLLPGTYRGWLLERGELAERVIARDELANCSRIFLMNSVRGMWKVELNLL